MIDQEVVQKRELLSFWLFISFLLLLRLALVIFIILCRKNEKAAAITGPCP
jgi:hypothetical protein